MNFTPDKKPYKKLPPFKGWVLQNFPFIEADFDALNEYQMMCKVIEYLKVFQGNLDNMDDNINSLYNSFVELQNYVNEYFDNLDVQEEVNHKLDEMVEQGTLQEIIADYLNSKAIFGFDTVNSMKQATNLIVGSYAQTLGYYDKNDNGGAVYKITDSIPSLHYETLNNGLYAELIIDKILNIKQLGAYGDNTHDDSSIFNLATTNYNSIYIPSGIYKISNAINLPENVSIKGENKENTIIVKNESTPTNAIFNFTGSGKVYIENLTLNCNDVADYGILSNVTISKFKINNVTINNPITAGIYTNKSTYLGIIEKVIVNDSGNYGFYLVPVDKNSYTNTSINITNCYCSEATNGYRIDGSYMNMENCACDGISNISYDLRGFIGSLISCGSESYSCNYMFYGDNFTNATVVNAHTFASYDNADSTHIYTGGSSTWVFIGGKLAQKYRSELNSGLGRFLEQSNDSHIKFIGTEVRGTFDKASIITSGIEVSDFKGSVFNKQDVLYIGYNSTNFGDEISANLLPSSSIYLGADNAPFISNNGSRIESSGVNTGDIVVSKTPNKIGGMGWISNTNHSGTFRNGSFSKIPIVQSGATENIPSRGLAVGDMYFDTTVGKPKWCTSVGRQQDEYLSFSTAPSSDGNIIITFNGNNYIIPVVENMTKSQLYQALKNANIEGLIILEQSSNVRCQNKDYKGFGGQSMFTIDVGTTGAVINDYIATSGQNPQWKSISDFE